MSAQKTKKRPAASSRKVKIIKLKNKKNVLKATSLKKKGAPINNKKAKSKTFVAPKKTLLAKSKKPTIPNKKKNSLDKKAKKQVTKNSKKPAPKTVAKKPVFKKTRNVKIAIQTKPIAKKKTLSSTFLPKKTKNIKKKLVLKKIIHKKPTHNVLKNKQKRMTSHYQNNNTPPLKASNSAMKEEAKALVLKARKRTATPSIFKIRTRKNTPIIFTLDDVKKILSTQSTPSKSAPPLVKKTPPPITKIPDKILNESLAPRVLGAASLVDILGFNPKNAKAITPKDEEASKIPDKFKPYYRLLVSLRNHIQKEMDIHVQDTLKRSSKDDSGNLSSYSQHMADAGTDTFDRDFALSILSNEQDALFEIDEAIQRMVTGSYGICEVTGKPIPKERLLAVPFTRCSLEGQKELEKSRRRMSQRSTGVGVFAEIFDDENTFIEDEENSET